MLWVVILEVTLQVDTSRVSFRVSQSWGDTPGVKYGCNPLAWAAGIHVSGMNSWSGRHLAQAVLRMDIPGVDFRNGCPGGRLWGCETTRAHTPEMGCLNGPHPLDYMSTHPW